MSRRTERVGSLIRNLVAEVIQRRLSDPRIEPLTSITRVAVSDDLLVATVHVSVMAPDARRKLTLRALEHAAKRIRGLIADQLTMRHVPELRFKLDEGLQHAVDTVALLDRLEQEHARADEPQPADATSPTELESATDPQHKAQHDDPPGGHPPDEPPAASPAANDADGEPHDADQTEPHAPRDARHADPAQHTHNSNANFDRG